MCSSDLLEAFELVEGKKSRGLQTALMESATQADKEIHHILWAACRADQTSADAKIGSSWHGAFTYFWVKEMRACQNKLSRSQLLQKIRADLKAGKYSQIPQLESEATKRQKTIG